MQIQKIKKIIILIIFIFASGNEARIEKYDTSILCNACHVDQKYEIHPINMENTEIKTTLPLLNNKIVCLTCHIFHSDDPLSRDKKSFHTDYLLRVPNYPIPDLCINCHNDKKNIISTPHDLNRSYPYEKNHSLKDTLKTGTCSACHLIHNGSNINLWSQEIFTDSNTLSPQFNTSVNNKISNKEEKKSDKDIISLFCTGCHNKKGYAKNKILNEFNHPVNLEVVQKGITTTLPLFNEKAKKILDGKITCATCHEVHGTSSAVNKSGYYIDFENYNHNNFLRINNSKNSALCTNCHKLEGLILNSPHDIAEVANSEKNIFGKTSQDTGICSSCHFVHSGKGKDNFSREYGSGEDVITKKCTSCHAPGKIGEKKLTGENSHPINIPIISLEITTNLNLFDQDGKRDPRGTIKCLTCHNIHVWSPYKSILEKRTKKDEELNEDIIKKNVIGKIVYVKNNVVYVNRINTQKNINKDEILSVIRDRSVIGKIKIKNFNPFASDLEIYAVIIEEYTLDKIKNGDIVLTRDISSGDGTSSFLNIQNDHSELCINCHRKQDTMIKTQHDISSKFPDYMNSQGKTIFKSGACSACHSVHNAKSTHILEIDNKLVDKIDTISKLCINCHMYGGLSNKKIGMNHHPLIKFIPNVKNLIPPPNYIPLYELSGIIGFWDNVSCATCHNVHQWDPENPKKCDISEGDSNNSFLRMRNDKKQLCEACHAELTHIHENQLLIMAGLNKEGMRTESVLPNKATQPAAVLKEIKVEIANPKDKSTLNAYSQIITGNVDNEQVTGAQILINGKAIIIPIVNKNFSYKAILKEGKNTIRVIAATKDGKSGSSMEITCSVDPRKPKIYRFDYSKPVSLTDDFRMKIIFDQTMDTTILPFIYFVTGNKQTIIPNSQISTQAKFFEIFKEKNNQDQYFFKNMNQGELLLNEDEYYSYDAKPKVAVFDAYKDIIPGAGNNRLSIHVTSNSEPKGEVYTLNENNQYAGIFTGEIEFGRWAEPNDKLIAVNDRDDLIITYNLGTFISTYKPYDTYITSPVIITQNMNGLVRVIVENAMGINGNIMDKDESESFNVNPNLFFIKNRNPISIQEKNITRSNNIHLNFKADNAVLLLISEEPNFSNCNWETYKDEKEYTLSPLTGIKTVYVKFKNKYNAESQIFKTSIEYIPIQYKIILDKDIDKDMTLEKNMGPFLIRKSISVLEDAVLKIESGTKFWIDTSLKEKIKIKVFGKIQALGNEANKIIFTSNSIEPKHGDWEGIEIANSNQNHLEYVNIEYAANGLSFIEASGLIKNCKLENNSNSGILCDHSNPNITDNEFSNNKIGLIIKNISGPEISNNYITSNETGIFCESISLPKIFGNTVVRNSYAGIQCTSMSSPPISDNNIIQNNQYGIYINKSSPMIYKNNISENNIGIWCENFYNPFLVKNNNIFNNKEYAIRLYNFNKNLDIIKNWWSVKSSDIIDKIIFDYNDNNAEGKLIYSPILESPLVFKNAAMSIDRNKPILLTTIYQNPANLTSNYQISFVFNKSLNPYILPKVNLFLENNEILNTGLGKFSSINIENDTYILSNIVLDANKKEKIYIIIENAQDLTGNIMDKVEVGYFTLDPTLILQEGNYISSDSITLMINASNAKSMIISEDFTFENEKWETYTQVKKVQ
ncbi:right-handed parallel beta-helix repeat-containing protein, partial [Candidatus Poribacteria bacterium]|nr:right-handed parallel beta-helix repeat-containing protein [Candidatus Poribacteria bacterium]